jgi:hypothetical protein
MKNLFRTATVLSLALLAGIVLLVPTVAHGQINYQGRLTDAVGAPLSDGQYPIQFSLWTAATAGIQIWGPFVLDGGTDLGHGSLADLVNSRFNVIIGNRDTFDRSLTTSMAASPTAYLEIQVGADVAIAPRQIILPAPRALSADVIPNVTPNASGVDINGITTITGNTTITGDTTFDGHATVVSNLTVNATLSAGQISTGGRVMSASVEFWTGAPDPLKGGLFRQGGTGSYLGSDSANANDLVLTATTGKLHLQHGNGASAITIDTANNVGIGTEFPTQAKLVVRGSVNSRPKTGDAGGISDDSVVSYFLSSPTLDNSIYATSSIWAGQNVIASSDERIKTVQGRSDNTADLQSLLEIEITDYHYKDVLSKGNAPQKKVIAQQVEKVFPQAVSKQTDVVPDIYQVAATKDGWVELATDLKKGDRVKLIAETEEGIHEVLEVAEGKFRSDFKPEGDKIFVYGREVNDFRTVDYDAISMLNVSATQEVARRLEVQEAQLAAKDAELAQLREKNDALTQKLTVLEARDQLFEKRLTRLERTTSDVQLTGLKVQSNSVK